jgi:two-component system phosphate regulon sensor histidine kinase PhoR
MSEPAPSSRATPKPPTGEAYLRLINQINAVILCSRDLDVVLDRVADVIREVLEVERVSILLLDGVTRRLRVRAARGIPRAEWDRIAIPLGDGIAGRVAAEGMPLMARDIAATDLPAQGGRGYQDNSFISVPLAVQGRILGVLNVNNRSDGAPLEDTDLQLTLAVAGMISLAIENANLLANALTLQQHFRTVLSELIIGIIVADPRATVTLCNLVAGRILGIAPDQAIGRELDSVLPGALAELVHRLLLESQRTGTHAEEEIDLPVPIGKEMMPVRVTLTLLRDPCGDTQAMVLVLEDLSLGKEVAELRRLDELKSNFMAMVSHELRTPLTSIKGAVHLLESGECAEHPELRAGMVELLRRNTDRLIQEINNILDVNQIEHRTLSIFPARIDLAALLRREVESARPEFAAKDIRLDLEVGELPEVEADPERLEQVFHHLLDNAQKFTPAGGRVRVWTELDSEAVAIHLRDTGVGIEPHQRDKVFAKFYQLEHTLTRQAGGNGLGLFLAKGLVELHGGTIRFCPVSGPGAEVEVRLPLAPTGEDRVSQLQEGATDA